MAGNKKIVQLQDENGLFIYPATTLEAIAGSNTLKENFVHKEGDVMTGPLVSTGFIGPLTGNATSADKATADANDNNIVETYETKSDASDKLTEAKDYTDSKFANIKVDGFLPLTAGEEYKLIGALGLTEGIMYGTELPDSGFNGQLFFLEDDSPALPTGGGAGDILMKNSAANGDAFWSNKINTLNHLGGIGVYSRDDIGTSPNFNNPGINGFFEVRNSSETTGESGTKPFNSFGPMFSLKTPDNLAMLQIAGTTNDYYIRANQSADVTMTNIPWKRIWVNGDAVTGAIWNDYAEYRESDCEEFGYVLMENGDDTLSKTTERLSHFAGISSDTWGFSQGKTTRARTPIAVAGRVLAYTYQDRNNYKPGDCVCAAPGGTVDIMTREEIQNYPDRIVGTVSCVPNYEEWGGGDEADRDSVKINGRIWIKVK